jgi:flagellar protein FliO/FliZ
VEDVSLLSLLARLVVSMGVVLGVMALAAAALRRRGGGGVAGGRGPSPRLEVVARQNLGRNAALTLVRTGDQDMLLGVTDSAVTLLAARDVPEVELHSPEAPGTVSGWGPNAPSSAWKVVLDTLRERTVRRS